MACPLARQTGCIPSHLEASCKSPSEPSVSCFSLPAWTSQLSSPSQPRWGRRGYAHSVDPQNVTCVSEIGAIFMVGSLPGKLTRAAHPMLILALNAPRAAFSESRLFLTALLLFVPAPPTERAVVRGHNTHQSGRTRKIQHRQPLAFIAKSQQIQLNQGKSSLIVACPFLSAAVTKSARRFAIPWCLVHKVSLQFAPPKSREIPLNPSKSSYIKPFHTCFLFAYLAYFAVDNPRLSDFPSSPSIQNQLNPSKSRWLAEFFGQKLIPGDFSCHRDELNLGSK